MQVVKKTVLILFVIGFAFIVCMPKRHFYYQAEQILASEGIKINEKRIDEGFFTLTIEDAIVYVQGIDLIHIASAQLTSLLFYTDIVLKDVQLDDSLASMAPTSLRSITLKHTLFSPKEVAISGEGDFGVFQGNIDIASRTIHIDFEETAQLGALKRQLKKGEKGFYYEKSF